MKLALGTLPQLLSARQGPKGSGFHSDALSLNHIFNTK